MSDAVIKCGYLIWSIMYYRQERFPASNVGIIIVYLKGKCETVNCPLGL